MKKLTWLLLILTAVGTSAYAHKWLALPERKRWPQGATTSTMLRRFYDSRMIQDPFREANGKSCDLRPLFAWIQQKNALNDPPMPAWVPFKFKVSSIRSDGLLGYAWNPHVDNWVYNLRFIRGYPGKANLVDGSVIYFLAVEDGTYSFPSGTATSTIYAFNYGTRIDPPAMTNAIVELEKTNAVPAAAQTNQTKRIQIK